jgi:hypothetical protein
MTEVHLLLYRSNPTSPYSLGFKPSKDAQSKHGNSPPIGSSRPSGVVTQCLVIQGGLW